MRLPPGSRLLDHLLAGASLGEIPQITRTRRTSGTGGLSQPQALNP